MLHLYSCVAGPSLAHPVLLARDFWFHWLSHSWWRIGNSRLEAKEEWPDKTPTSDAFVLVLGSCPSTIWSASQQHRHGGWIWGSEWGKWGPRAEPVGCQQTAAPDSREVLGDEWIFAQVSLSTRQGIQKEESRNRECLLSREDVCAIIQHMLNSKSSV